jgi:DNA-nicking Smr family endonuclease
VDHPYGGQGAGTFEEEFVIPEVDLHGLTKDEALMEADREVNHAFIQETEDRRLRFITGWGGVLRPAVQKFLVEHPLIKEISVEGPSLKVVLEDL